MELEDYESQIVADNETQWTQWIGIPGFDPFPAIRCRTGSLRSEHPPVEPDGSVGLEMWLHDRDGVAGGAIAEVYLGGEESGGRQIRFPGAHSSEVAGLFQRAVAPGMVGLDVTDVLWVLPKAGGLGRVTEYPIPTVRSHTNEMEARLTAQLMEYGEPYSALVVLPVDQSVTPDTLDLVASSMKRYLSSEARFVLSAPLSETDGERLRVCLFWP
ncbi:hypothetical protein [Thioalkalivibrio sp. ALMg3]|uniref:hypothetical protein n=1 Tax=Thioalkalivibrio sp. ALMg3 TaxID=1158163 RepID=UPI001E4D2107|nr:hypothetical protein [Thioalkalivibrio sp. ALMg3]